MKTIFTFILSGLTLVINAQSMNVDWAKSNSDVGAGSMAVGSDGSTYYTGAFFATKDFDPGPGVYNLTSNGTSDIAIYKLDPLGNFLWAKSIGSTGLDRGIAIELDNQDNIYIVGDFNGSPDFDAGSGVQTLTSNGNSDVFLLKLNSNGDFVFAKSFGGTQYENAKSIHLVNGSSILIGGEFQGTAQFNPYSAAKNLSVVNATDAFVLKLDWFGNFEWVKQLGGSRDVELEDIETDQANNIIVVGEYYGTVDFDPSTSVNNITSNGWLDSYILKLDYNGNFIWAKSFGGPYQDLSFHVQIDALNNIYVGGIYDDAVDFDPGTGSAIITSHGNEDIFISKLDQSGNYQWTKTFGGTSTFDRIYGLKIDQNSNLTFAGTFSNSVDFDPGINTLIFTPIDFNRDGYIAQLNSNGDLNWAYSIGGAGTDLINAIAIDSIGNIYSNGYIATSADIDPSPNQSYILSTGVYFQKVSFLTVGLNEKIESSLFSIYPNPANNTVQIKMNETIKQIRVFNIAGKVVSIENNSSFSVEKLEDGMYFLEIETTDGKRTKEKLVVNH